jgi:hypothetical protein
MKINGRIAVAVLAILGAASWGECRGQTEFIAGTSGRSARTEAIQAIPLDQLSPAARQKTQRILQSAAIYRRMPVTTIHCDPDLYLFAVRYPEIIVDIWRLMGVSTMTLNRTGNFSMACNDGAGTVSNVELVYGTPTTQVFLANGRYTGNRLMKQLDGACVILLRTEYSRSAQGLPLATSTLDVFVDIENNSAEWVARIVSPLFGGTADRNFVESLTFLERLSQTAAENGPGVVGMARRLTNVHPQVRGRFAQIAEVVYERNLVNEVSARGGSNDVELRQTHYQPQRNGEAESANAR